MPTTDNQNLGLISAQAPNLAAPAPLQTVATTAQKAATGGTAAAQQAATQRVSIDPTTQTVQGQLAAILAAGNPLLVQAQTRAKQEANRRGLLNSSMAVGAGESALYDAAMPIAQSDAGAYNQAALSNADLAQQTELANVGARNRAQEVNIGELGTTNRFNVGAANTAAQQTAQEQNLNRRFSAEQTQQTSLADADNQMKLMLQQMDANTRTDLVNIEANYRTLMQASDSASSLYSQTLKNIADITSNPALDAAAKNAAIARQKEFLQNGMNLIGAMNNIGVAELLDFGGGTLAQPAPDAAGPAPTPVAGPQPDQSYDTSGFGGA